MRAGRPETLATLIRREQIVEATLQNFKGALGLAAVPAFVLGAFGYTEQVTIPVLLSCLATTFVALQFD